MGHTRVEKIEENVIWIPFHFLSTAGYVSFSWIPPVWASEYFFLSPVQIGVRGPTDVKTHSKVERVATSVNMIRSHLSSIKSSGCLDCVPQSEGVLDKHQMPPSLIRRHWQNWTVPPGLDDPQQFADESRPKTILKRYIRLGIHYRVYHPRYIVAPITNSPPYRGQDIILLLDNTVIIGPFWDVLDCNAEHVI